MDREGNGSIIDRREFIKISAAAAIGGQTLLSVVSKEAKAVELIHRNERPSMTYRKLGRTNFMSSRLVFGCGAALVGGKAVRVLDRAFEAGINHFDVGTEIYYRGSETNLAPFLKAHRDEVWVVSKAPARSVSFWTQQIDASLKNLQTDYVDAYYLMAVNSPELVRNEELYNAFITAKATGKVRHFGLSTHKNASKVLEAAIETGWYDLVMVGITPAGYYDWSTKDLEKGTPSLVELQPLLERARSAGIGVIGMKAARYLAPSISYGKGDVTAFDNLYDEAFRASPLSPFQRAYAYVLEHGLDVMNADMQNFKHLEENIIAATTSESYFSR
jgi:aryl-alcohol dehydrogenase-like predicted oxidoreductase